MTKNQPVTMDQGVELYRQTPGAVLLDVRTEEEYEFQRVPGSLNWPLDRIDEYAGSKQAPLFVYCYSGARSEQACLWLRRNGYTATNIGGISQYHGEVE